MVTNKQSTTQWGGEINVKDFSTYEVNCKRIKNQADADKFQKKINEDDELKKYSSYSMEDLRKMKLISNTNGRPNSNLTDELWQREFALRKFFIQPYPKTKRYLGNNSRKPTTWNEEENGEYQGDTSWQNYCWFINDVLRNIRCKSHPHDYLYYLYQVEEIYKFHPDELETRYCDGYWEVWLREERKE